MSYDRTSVDVYNTNAPKYLVAVMHSMGQTRDLSVEDESEWFWRVNPAEPTYFSQSSRQVLQWGGDLDGLQMAL